MTILSSFSVNWFPTHTCLVERMWNPKCTKQPLPDVKSMNQRVSMVSVCVPRRSPMFSNNAFLAFTLSAGDVFQLPVALTYFLCDL